MTVELSDPTSWPAADVVTDGIGGRNPYRTGSLAGRAITVLNDGGSVVEHIFDASEVRWDYDAVPSDPHGDATGTDIYEAFEIDDGLYHVAFHVSSQPSDEVSLFVDLKHGWAMTAVSMIQDAATPRIMQLFIPAAVREVPATGNRPTPGAGLAGKHVLWTFGAGHQYEHVHLSPTWLTWQGLAGPEIGQAADGATPIHATFGASGRLLTAIDDPVPM